MTTVTAPNRTIVAVIFLVGGALQILGALLGMANAGNAGGFYLLSNLALGAGFVLLLAWFARTTVARIAYFIAALGWLLLALTSLVNLGIVGNVAVFIAIVGSVFAGVIVLIARPFGAEADILFLVAMIVGALNLLLSQVGSFPRFAETVVVVAFGALLVWFALDFWRKKLPSPAS